MKGAMFETHVSQCENSSMCVQVAFIIAGSTHAVYYILGLSSDEYYSIHAQIRQSKQFIGQVNGTRLTKSETIWCGNIH